MHRAEHSCQVKAVLSVLVAGPSSRRTAPSYTRRLKLTVQAPRRWVELHVGLGVVVVVVVVAVEVVVVDGVVDVTHLHSKSFVPPTTFALASNSGLAPVLLLRMQRLSAVSSSTQTSQPLDWVHLMLHSS